MLRDLQAGGRRVFRSADISRTHRERLRDNGFLAEIIKGWWMSTSPKSSPGDTTQWYASFWAFCTAYCEARFGENWHLSPEQSLMLHAESNWVPSQLVVYAPKGSNNNTQLLHGTSIYDLRQKKMPPPDDLTVRDGLRVFTPEAALVKLIETFFQRNPVEVQVVLAALGQGAPLLSRLLDGGHSTVAGRLAGALRRMGRSDQADRIVLTMTTAGFDVRESDPFALDVAVARAPNRMSPISGRLAALWQTHRNGVLAHMPPPPGQTGDADAYLRAVQDSYRQDAYHSLSIEGYSVTPDLVERVRDGRWNPEHDGDDQEDRDALAARGYFQAFERVKADIGAILGGAAPAERVRSGVGEWYLQLFAPSVAAGLMKPRDLAGYRDQPVYIRASRHVPPRAEVVPDAMDALFGLLDDEPEPAVRAVLGHWMLGYVHPYPDGNGRIARFLMNVMLASGGYPWTVIRVQDRAEYMSALEAASVSGDVSLFARFIATRLGA